MDIQLATTDDMLEELHRRSAHFVYAGVPNTNRRRSVVQYVCQADSREEMLTLIRDLYRRVKTTSDIDAVD